MITLGIPTAFQFLIGHDVSNQNENENSVIVLLVDEHVDSRWDNFIYAPLYTQYSFSLKKILSGMLKDSRILLDTPGTGCKTRCVYA